MLLATPRAVFVEADLNTRKKRDSAVTSLNALLYFLKYAMPINLTNTKNPFSDIAWKLEEDRAVECSPTRKLAFSKNTCKKLVFPIPAKNDA